MISWLQSPSAVILEPKKIKSVTVSIVSPFSSSFSSSSSSSFLLYNIVLILPYSNMNLPRCTCVPHPQPPSHLQYFPASGAFPMSQLFASGGESIGVSASASVPSNEYSGLISFSGDWFISLQSKALSRLLSNTTVQKHQLFSIQLSLYSNSRIHASLLEKL